MNQTRIYPGQIWTHDFEFSQEQVNEFAKVTGDTNPVHLDSEYAAQTAFKSPVVHGIMGAAVFSKVLGTIMPGNGTLYLSQTLSFTSPIRVQVPYQAVFTVLEEVAKKRYRVLTQIIDTRDKTIVIDGEATIRTKV